MPDSPTFGYFKKGYALHLYTAGFGSYERDTHCMSTLQVVKSDTPCMSIVHRLLLMVLFLLYDIKKSYVNAGMPEKS
jgi:hypothetical protein